MLIEVFARRWVLTLLVVFVFGISALRAVDPFAEPAREERGREGDEVRLQARWVRLTKDPVLKFREDWSVHEREEAKTLLDGLVMAKLADVEAVARLCAGADRPAVIALPALKGAQGEPVSSVMITVGGVPQEFTVRHVGAEVELSLVTRSADRVILRAVVKRTRFLGFKEYAGSATDRPVPSGFYQPIFDTDTREFRVTLKPTQQAILLIDWPETTAEEWRKWELDLPTQMQASPKKLDAPALLVVGLE